MKVIKLDEGIYRQDENDFTYFESKFFYDLMNYRKYDENLSGDEKFFEYLTWIYNNFQLTKERISFDSLKSKLIDFLDDYYLDNYYKSYNIKDKKYYLLIKIPEYSFLITGIFSEDEFSLKIPDSITDDCIFRRFSIFFNRNYQDRLIVNESSSEEGVIDCIASMLGIKNYKIDSTSFTSYLSW